MDVISLHNISKQFILKARVRMSRIVDELINGPSEAKCVLVNINLKVKKNNILGIVGPNSAGKTTLLNIIAGIMKPTAGICEIRGKVASCMGSFDSFYLDLSLKENLYVYGAFLGNTRSRLNKFFNSEVEFGYMQPFLDLKLYKCSSGIISRAIFTLTVLSEANILLFDEMPMSTDINFQERAIPLLRKMKENGKTIIISSHNPYFLERICDEAILLEKGKITNFDKADKVLVEYRNKYGNLNYK